MISQIVILLTGFVLTTVGGGILGYYFQSRSWRHQNRARLEESERNAATEVFESISMLMDKRLYRMRQLNWRLIGSHSGKEAIEAAMEAYRQVLYEWNDNLNRNLALTQAYFGGAVRGHLEGVVYEEFKRIGAILEEYYLEQKRTERVVKLDTEISRLGSEIYELNLRMIARIQRGTVGIFNPDMDESRN